MSRFTRSFFNKSWMRTNVSRSFTKRYAAPFGRYLAMAGTTTATFISVASVFPFIPKVQAESRHNDTLHQYAHDFHDHDHHDDHGEVFHLLVSLRELAHEVDAYALLKSLLIKLKESGQDGTVVDLPFVRDLFKANGITDPCVAESIFTVMDWNKSGTLEPQEIAATFTLFQTGHQLERYKFLFRCLDLDRSGKVDKDEFRALMTALLEARYHISGLQDPKDPDEWYKGMTREDYHSIAKLKSNMLVRTIFNFADQNRDGELNMKEFLHWCKRGGHEVAVLNDLLNQSTKGALHL